MISRRAGQLAAALGMLWLLPGPQVHAQSITGAGTIPIDKVGKGGGQGTPKGNLTAAAKTVNGEPVGVIRVRLPGFAEATVDVDCLHVVGNRAFVGGPIRAGSSFDPAFTYLYLAIEDNGEPEDGESVDRALAWIGDGDLCDLADFLLFISFDIIDPPPVSHGNYKISP
jgi:hypothetical protein